MRKGQILLKGATEANHLKFIPSDLCRQFLNELNRLALPNISQALSGVFCQIGMRSILN
jgi:hypothetical protein